MTLVAQLFASRGVIRHELADRAPEALGMVHFEEVRDFMSDDVIEQADRHLYEAPVEMDPSADVTASPARARARQMHLWTRFHTEQASVVIDTLTEAHER